VGLLAVVNAESPHYRRAKGKGAPAPQDAPQDAEEASEAEMPATGAPPAARRRGEEPWRRAVNRAVARGAGAVRWRRYLARVWFRRQRARALLALGGRVPLEYRRAYTSSVNDRAFKRYDAAPYPGRLLVIRGAGLFEEPTTGWGGRALGGLELREIGGRHEYLSHIMNEPHVQQLARIVQDELVHERYRDGDGAGQARTADNRTRHGSGDTPK
jgi:hypothetical protein